MQFNKVLVGLLLCSMSLCSSAKFHDPMYFYAGLETGVQLLNYKKDYGTNILPDALPMAGANLGIRYYNFAFEIGTAFTGQVKKTNGFQQNSKIFTETVYVYRENHEADLEINQFFMDLIYLHELHPRWQLKAGLGVNFTYPHINHRLLSIQVLSTSNESTLNRADKLYAGTFAIPRFSLALEYSLGRELILGTRLVYEPYALGKTLVDNVIDANTYRAKIMHSLQPSIYISLKL